MTPRRLALAAVAFAVTMLGSQADAKQQRVEAIDASGIIDGSVERSLLATIAEAERSDAALVVIQISSKGVVDERRADRIIRAIQAADVRIVTWIGPPGAQAANGAALIAQAAAIRAMAPGSVLGPVETRDLRRPIPPQDRTAFDQGISADEALDEDVVDIVEPSLEALLGAVGSFGVEEIDADAAVRLHKLDLFGRMLHAAAQPSITYLLLLLALVGIVFELFHPSTGPAGISGLAALALALYGVATLGGSWIGVALVVAGVGAFCVDLRYESIGLFSAGGLVALTTGSLLLFREPWLRVSPWVLALGIIGMLLFLIGAMTRVLRDLRAIARGELEVTDAHPHPNGQGASGDA